jgi:ribosome-associated heat shock protein Hsp15
VSAPAEHCRIDVWLWRARFCKTRSLAARMVAEGRVRLSRSGAELVLDKPSRAVRPGDRLFLDLGGREATVQIEALGARRGPAPEARALYCVTETLPSVDEVINLPVHNIERIK